MATETSASAQEAELAPQRPAAAAALAPATELGSSTFAADPVGSGGAAPLLADDALELADGTLELADGTLELAMEQRRGRARVPLNRRWMGRCAAVATAFLALSSAADLTALVWLSLMGTALLGHQTRWGRAGGVLTRRSRDVAIALLVMAILGLLDAAWRVLFYLHLDGGEGLSAEGWVLLGPALIGLPLAIAVASGVVDTAPFRKQDDESARRLATEASSVLGATRWRNMQKASVLALVLVIVVGTYEQIDLRWWTQHRFIYICRDYRENRDDDYSEPSRPDPDPWAAYCHRFSTWGTPSVYPGDVRSERDFYVAILSIMPPAIVAGALTIAVVARRRLEIAVANIGVPALVFVPLTQIAVQYNNNVQAATLYHYTASDGVDPPIPNPSYYTVGIVRLTLSTAFWMIVTSVMGHIAWTAFAAFDDMIDSGNGRRDSEP